MHHWLDLLLILGIPGQFDGTILLAVCPELQLKIS
jgi:hypothetical protein